jgi:hypothetical protein
MPELPPDREDDPTVPPQTTTDTERHARIRRIAAEPTRLDARSLYDIPDPTEVVTTTPPPRVSPIGAHTRGASATVPPAPVTPVADTVNAILDERDRAANARTRVRRRPFRTDRRKVRTVREEAARRAEARLRHERHLEVVETVRAYLVLIIIFCLLVIVVGAGIVGYGIIAGFFDWRPTRV